MGIYDKFNKKKVNSSYSSLKSIKDFQEIANLVVSEQWEQIINIYESGGNIIQVLNDFLNSKPVNDFLRKKNNISLFTNYPDLISKVAYALGIIGERNPSAIEKAIPQLIKLLDYETIEDFEVLANLIVGDAVHALLRIGMVDVSYLKEATPKLIKLLQADDGYICGAAVKALAEVGSTEALDAVRPLLNDTRIYEVKSGYNAGGGFVRMISKESIVTVGQVVNEVIEKTKK